VKDTIYLTVSRQGVLHMRKSYTGTRRGEAIIKLGVTVDDKAFQPPMLEQQVVVNDWRAGIDMEDVQFNQNVITEEEAEMVRQKRLAKMSEILQGQGYTITPPEANDDTES
jgi:hypothetical protein